MSELGSEWVCELVGERVNEWVCQTKNCTENFICFQRSGYWAYYIEFFEILYDDAAEH